MLVSFISILEGKKKEETHKKMKSAQAEVSMSQGKWDGREGHLGVWEPNAPSSCQWLWTHRHLSSSSMFLILGSHFSPYVFIFMTWL